MKTLLCVCTYRRPAGLLTLLESLPALQEADGLEIVVCDNDGAGEGLAVCHTLPDSYPFPVHTLSADKAGISAARNAVCHYALAMDPDLIAFLDDDEWPEPQWLAELKRIQSRYQADAVGGPTRPVFPPETPALIRNNPYYGADMGLADGSSCQLQAGGNFMITQAALKALAPDFFHQNFAHSGGEDLAFFTQLAQHGYSMRWAASAIVHEPVPDDRLSDDWLRQRVINIHNARVRVAQLLQPGPLAKMVRMAKTLALSGAAGAVSLLSLIWPAQADEARLLRWKLQGKLGAHFGRATVRREHY